MKRYNKKGIMIPFLTTLLLAIIVFAPACMVSSKFFRTSTQALENFESFMEDIDEFAVSKPIGYRGSSLLIMDEGTAIIYFDNQSEDTSGMKITVAYEESSGDGGSYPTYNYLEIKKPSECSLGKSCVCLFRSADELTAGVITGNQVTCKELDYHLEVEACGWGEGSYSLTGYSCSDKDFIIEREFIEEFSSAYYKNERRQTVYLTRLDTAIRLSGVS